MNVMRAENRKKRHALGASVLYDTTSARMPDLPHGKPD
jgi:hypothetical protein